jgi:hypothetical protein
VLDRRFVEQVAATLGTRPGLVEKEWHVIRAIRIVADVDHGEACPVFSGGTSLSVGWGLIKRFSEDIDFKVAMPLAATSSQARTRRSAYREKVLSALRDAGFELIGKPLCRNLSSFFSADFGYPTMFERTPGLRPHLRIEMTFQTPTLPAIERPIRSLVARAQKGAAEVPAFPCVDPVETAADKLSALAWRMCVRIRGTKRDDPSIIRHLHDLAALEPLVANAPVFNRLLRSAVENDTGRGGEDVPVNPSERFALMLDRLTTDAAWEHDYETYVHSVSFAMPDEMISFSNALAATRRLIAQASDEISQEDVMQLDTSIA